MKEGIDENHPWVTDDAIDKEGGQCVWHNKCFGYCIVQKPGPVISMESLKSWHVRSS